MCIPASHCQYTSITPYTEPNGLIITTTIVNENLERWYDRINSQPKGHGHPRVALAGIEKTAARVSSEIHISQVAVNVDGITNHTRNDCSSSLQRAIQGSKHHISLSHIQRKCHHWIYKIQGWSLKSLTNTHQHAVISQNVRHEWNHELIKVNWRMYASVNFTIIGWDDISSRIFNTIRVWSLTWNKLLPEFSHM